MKMQKFKLLSFNSFQKPLMANDVENEYKYERNNYFIENELDKFDIVVLQEQFCTINPRPVLLLEKAEARGFKYFHKTKDPAFSGKFWGNGGLVTLSKYPIVDADEISFEHSVAIDKLLEKGVVWTKVLLPNGKHIHLFNTHILAFYHGQSYHDDMWCKIKCVRQMVHTRQFIKEKLAKHYSKGDLAMICGDFNLNGRNNTFVGADILQYFELDKELTSRMKVERNELHFYQHLLNYNNGLFKLENVIYKDYEEYPVTMGNYTVSETGEKVPMDSVLTQLGERFDYACLDHIFEIKVKGNTENQEIRIVDGSSKVEEFFVSDQLFTQLSDHYGLSLDIVYRTK